MTVRRRSAAAVDRSVQARLLTLASMLGPPLLQPADVTAIAPESATVALSIVGLAVVIAGKVTLGRSFGLIPANRGIVSTGLYRLVRHPIYLGYLLTHLAFLAANPSPWNAVILLGAERPCSPGRCAKRGRSRSIRCIRPIDRQSDGECVQASSDLPGHNGSSLLAASHMGDVPPEHGDGRAEVSARRVVECTHERVALERGLDDAALDAGAAAVNQANLAQTGGVRGADILVDN